MLDMMDLIESSMMHVFPLGRNPRVKSCRLTLDPVKAVTFDTRANIHDIFFTVVYRKTCYLLPLSTCSKCVALERELHVCVQMHRPLLLYLVAQAIYNASRAFLALQGYKHHKVNT